MARIALRDLDARDLDAIFGHQRDPESNRMAAFAALDPEDRAAFDRRWRLIMRDRAIVKRAVLADGDVVGHIVSYEREGEREIGYWIARSHWRRGIATAAVQQFLADVPLRPLYARVAKDNLASIRVLEKCGFLRCGEDIGFALARGQEVEEWIFTLA